MLRRSCLEPRFGPFAALDELAKAADGGSRQVEYWSYGRTTVIAQPWSIAVLERLFVVLFEGDEAAVDREATGIARRCAHLDVVPREAIPSFAVPGDDQWSASRSAGLLPH
jgi:hypothetical protein